MYLSICLLHVRYYLLWAVAEKELLVSAFQLLTPYRNNGHLVQEQRLFNYVLSRCRSRVEHLFGKFFGQWRRLKFLHIFEFEYAVHQIVATFVVHNFMILNGNALQVSIISLLFSTFSM